MAKARDIPGLVASEAFAVAASRAVGVRTEEVFAHAVGVLDTEDIERVHAMRVATRRLRAVLEIFAPCFPKRDHRQLLKEVKALADALGGRRDRDVAIAAFDRIGRALTAEDRHGIGKLCAELRAGQAAANERLAEQLEVAESAELRTRLLAMAATAELGP
ncbi:MAG: hypothetical protein NVSMB25_03750 [Thermoleophilaceae bacterium]